MADRWITAKLEHLVEGELGQAVLNGFFMLAYEACRAILDGVDGDERLKATMERAAGGAAQLAVPDSVPAEAREEWRKAAVEAVYYAREYMPELVG
jgi:hypothetical protein